MADDRPRADGLLDPIVMGVIWPVLSEEERRGLRVMLESRHPAWIEFHTALSGLMRAIRQQTAPSVPMSELGQGDDDAGLRRMLGSRPN
jgi:hypothetical protein